MAAAMKVCGANRLIKNTFFSVKPHFLWSVCTVRNRSFRYNYKPPHNYHPPGRPRSPEEYGPPEYPAVKPRWPPGNWDTVDCDLSEKLCWRLHDLREEMKGIGKAKERLEKLAGAEDRVFWKVSPFENHAGKTSEDLLQFITRTHHVEGDGFPITPFLKDDMDSLILKVKAPIINAILQEHEHQYIYELAQGELSSQLDEQNKFRARKQVKAMANTIISCLAADYPHLLWAQTDEDVRVESFWKTRGFKDISPKAGVKLYSLLDLHYEHMADWQMRTELPLPDIVSADDELCSGEFPSTNFSLSSFGIQRVKRRATSVSGHWIGDPCEFTPLSIHVLPGYKSLFGSYGDHLLKSIEKKFGLTTAFGSCLTQAHNQGFNWLLDLTYPLTTQSLITLDGSCFQLFTYQLNTLEMWHTRHANNKCNLMWMTDRIKLYDIVEGGEVKGFNDEALKMLLNCFLITPAEKGVDLRPFLTEEEAPMKKKRYINNIGEEPLPFDKPERFQYPRNSVYFQ